MPTIEKKQIVEAIETKARQANAVVVTSLFGLKTTEINELRKKLRPLNSEYCIVKNSLTRIAFKNAGMEQLASALQGPSAIVIERGDPLVATKVIVEFAKTHENIKIRGGFFDGKIISDKEVVKIASLPPKEVLLSTLLATLNSPLVNLVSVLQAPMRDLVNTLDAISKKSTDK